MPRVVLFTLVAELTLCAYAESQARVWQPVTLEFQGPASSESATPNPFTDYRLTVRFSHNGQTVAVPGYYAADGKAAESGAESGNVWKAIFVPHEEGKWTYSAEFVTGSNIAADPADSHGKPVDILGATGSLDVGPADSTAPGFASKGMLRYTGKRYLQFAGTGEHYLKGGVDSPENMLAYADFDDTKPTHRFEPHAGGWRPGDPEWRDGKGKNLIGGLNYLASKGINALYFLTMNVDGDGNDVWPWISPTERLRFDCSKLDQWEIVFSHMDRLGILMHVVHQEQENDQLLDGGELGPERKLYYRELVARFGHHPALVWNLGEENTNTGAQRKAFASYVRSLDPYGHPIVVHTYPKSYDAVYTPLLGFPDFEGASLQIANMTNTHAETLKWVRESARSGRPWVVCLDEIGPPSIGVKPDSEDPAHDEVRRFALWGNLMAGGAGCEWFFQSDIRTEDWRTREAMWDQTRIALTFFHRDLPFMEMEPREEIVHGGGAWCLAKENGLFAIYAALPADCRIDLPPGGYSVHWYDPRTGGALQKGAGLRGGPRCALGVPPSETDKDWAAIVRHTGP